jgi:hypothetical protein
MTTNVTDILYPNAVIPDESMIANLCAASDEFATSDECGDDAESALESIGPEEAIEDPNSTIENEAANKSAEFLALAAEERIGSDPTLWLYRDRTIGMLKRYLRMSIEVGRLPSLLGREFFRTHVTSYSVGTFEDSVIFVYDVERSLEKLDAFEKKMVAKMIFQEYPQDEAARLLGCGRRTLVRRFPEMLDKLSEFFLKGGLIDRLPAPVSKRENACQGGEIDENDVSDSESSE